MADSMIDTTKIDPDEALARRFGVWDTDPEVTTIGVKDEDLGTIERRGRNGKKRSHKAENVVAAEAETPEEIAELSIVKMHNYANTLEDDKKQKVIETYYGWVKDVINHRNFYDEREILIKTKPEKDEEKDQTVSYTHKLIYKPACLYIEHTTYPPEMEIAEDKKREWNKELKREVLKIMKGWKNTSKEFRKQYGVI